jgi:hypothetical protein
MKEEEGSLRRDEKGNKGKLARVKERKRGDLDIGKGCSSG